MSEINEEKIIELSGECFGCPAKPCQKGCPLENDTTVFISLVKEQKYKEAFELLAETTVLMPICGRVCPHTKQCQGKCIRGIKSDAVEIGKMEAFIGDLALENDWKFPVADKEEKEYKVAIVGGGPAGLTCAQFLRRYGIQVTLFEKYNTLGGILNHGIPDFRLDKVKLNKWIDKILESGINVEYGKELGNNLSVGELEANFDSIFLSFGANVSTKMGIPGEELDGVYGGNEFLENGTILDLTGKTVVVSGGGNVAMDVSRTIKRSGAEHVYVVYRRSEKEMPAEQKEIDEAKEDGVEFLFQNNILTVNGNKDGKVKSIECIKTELVQKEGETRLSPVNIEGSNYELNCDYVIMAIGSKPEDDVVNSLGLELDRKGRIVVDENGRTSKKNIYAGGDIAENMGTVAYAARAGRNVAEAIVGSLQ
ncbi:MAG: FAD-dependent oxidoreductase [Clostridia bacterium]|nr:FAD-dependent oxidoreductase [Clostridia bacterium]